MTVDDPRAERLAERVAIAASLVFALVCFWELCAPLPGGHLGNAAGTAIAGENMVLWNLFGAVPEFTRERPTPAQLYTHHPYGTFLAAALFYKIFGHGWWTVRLPAAVMSALSPPLVYLIGRALWGAVPAAVATVAFVVMPIELSYASFQNLEVITIFFALIFSWGTVRLFQSWRTIYLWPSALGALGVCQSDWVGLVLVGTVGVFAFARAYVLPARLYGRVDHRQHARWFAWCTAAAVGTLVLYLALFAKASRLGDLLGSYEARSAGSSAPIASIFSQRRVMWLTWMLPTLALGAIALGWPISVFRLVRRRAEEAVPVAWMVAACFQYFVFKQGADVHVFWPQYFAPVAAFAFAALVWLVTRLRFRHAPLLALVPAAVALLLIARIGFVQAYQSRLTGGRFDDGGRYIAVDQDRSAFSQWAVTALPRTALVGLHRSFLRNWYVEYGLRRPVSVVLALPDKPEETRLMLVDARYTSGPELVKMASRHAPEIVGPFWRFDLQKPDGPPVALRYEEHQPRWWERYFVTGSDLVRSIGAEVDVVSTWAWREHLGVPSPVPADAEPRSFDDGCLLYDAALVRGDVAAQQRQRARLEAQLTHPLDVAFTGDLRLRGAEVTEGAATVVTLLWETGPAFAPVDADFLVRSRVVSPPPLWLTKTDYFEKEVAPPTALRPSLWKPGRLYAQTFVAMRRVGTEVFEGLFTQRGVPIRTLQGQDRVPLFTLK